MASNPPQQGGGFDINKLFRPPSPGPAGGGNLATSPSFPAQSSTQVPPFLTPSSSYPPPTGPYPFHYMPYPPAPVRPAPPPSPPTSGNDLLLAFFGNQTQNQNQNQNQSPSAPPVRLLSSKVPKGRHLVGDSLVYDIDARLPGEVQPQLEVTPITKYISDPGLVLGRQIAVNRSYICYGLKLGNIRILNINTALRSLLRGHTQRVTDMAFFAEDVHLLASASVDGRIFVWKINEGPDEEEKPQIFGKVVIALQILGHGSSMHPRVCWHPHKQEILIVSIGNRILKIDTIKVGKMEGFSVEEPLNCPIDKLIDGIQFVGKHDGEVTELSMCQWLTTRLASASVDGTVKIWEDRKPVPLAVFRPHDGYPVNSATFLTAPHRPDHIILVTGGLLNREIKIWVSASEEGWLLPSDAESWQCTQSFELKSSADSKIEDAFFNQVVALPRSGLVLLANAKKNAIYALHIDYGPHPAATRMDYIAEFTVTMPILSLTGTSETLPDGEHTVQVYCVQTQAIQQYALDLSQCLPPPLDIVELEKTDSGRVFDVTKNTDDSASPGLFNTSKPNELSAGYSTSLTSGFSVGSEGNLMPIRMERMPSSEVTTLSENISLGTDNKPTAVPLHSNAEHIYAPSPTVPLSPKLAQKSSGFKSPPNNDQVSDHPAQDYSGDGVLNIAKENKADVTPPGDSLQKNEKTNAQNDISVVPDPPLVFKHPTHLVTPSEILSTAACTSETVQIGHGGEAKVQNVVVSNGAENVEVEVKVVEEAGFSQTNETECAKEPHVIIGEKKEKAFYSQASDLGLQMASDFRREAHSLEGAQQINDASVADLSSKHANDGEGEGQHMMKNAPPNNIESDIQVTSSQSPSTATKARKHRGKNTQIPSSPCPSPYNSMDSNEPACSSGAQSSDAALAQLQSMQDMLEQLMSMQKEMQKQMHAIVSGPINKEGKRLEASLGRNLEKVVKSHNDALWSRFLEENAKHEKLERDRTQQISNLIINCMNKDMPAVFEKTLKKEIGAIGPVVARSITPNLERSISTAISESFQKGVGDKAVHQLDKSIGSRLEATVARQIQSQFQTSGKQALQDALRTSLETSVIPAFEMSCKTMFQQIESTFQKGLTKHTTAAQQQLETAHSSLTVSLRDAINSAASVTQILSGELAEGQRKILAIAAAGANLKDGNTLVKHLSNGPLAGMHEMPEAHLDPMEELSRFLAERKYDEAFTAALHRSDVSIVSWLCSQVDLHAILSTVPIPLSQGVLLALLQQLSCDMNNETSKKVSWMTDVAVAINPVDPSIAVHVPPIFEQVYQIVGHHRSLPNASVSESANLRVLMHVINSVLRTCK